MSVDVPATIWRPADGLGELTTTGVEAIDDTAGVALVDTTGVAVVDTGITFTQIPATEWVEDDDE